MPYTAPTVNYSETLNGTYTTITGVQSVSINRGRERFQDNFTPTVCQVELIPANSYALPFAVGQFIDVRDANNASSPCYFFGVITDVNRNYQMPYKTVTGAAPADRITITATGATGSIAQNSVTNLSYAADKANLITFLASQQAKVFTSTLSDNQINVSAINFTGGLFDLINGLLRTSQSFIDDLDSKRSFVITDFKHYAVTFNPGNGNYGATFSDAGTVGAFKMSALDFLSSVQNTFTKVEVTPNGGSAQSATTGVAPFNTLVYDTYNATNADAASLAQLILALQQFAAITPFTLTTNTMLSSSCTALSLLSTTDIYGQLPADRTMRLGSSVTIIFRGTTVLAQIQGINTVFYPDYAQVQLNLSPSLGAAFTLDSSAFGVLDQNRLGYP